MQDKIENIGRQNKKKRRYWTWQLQNEITHKEDREMIEEKGSEKNGGEKRKRGKNERGRKEEEK